MKYYFLGIVLFTLLAISGTFWYLNYNSAVEINKDLLKCQFGNTALELALKTCGINELVFYKMTINSTDILINCSDYIFEVDVKDDKMLFTIE